MSDHDFFFVNEAHKTDIFDGNFWDIWFFYPEISEWVEAQKFMVKYFNPQNKLPNKDQVPDQNMSNGQMMAKKIQVDFGGLVIGKTEINNFSATDIQAQT